MTISFQLETSELGRLAGPRVRLVVQRVGNVSYTKFEVSNKVVLWNILGRLQSVQ